MNLGLNGTKIIKYIWYGNQFLIILSFFAQTITTVILWTCLEKEMVTTGSDGTILLRSSFPQTVFEFQAADTGIAALNIFYVLAAFFRERNSKMFKIFIYFTLVMFAACLLLSAFETSFYKEISVLQNCDTFDHAYGLSNLYFCWFEICFDSCIPSNDINAYLFALRMNIILKFALVFLIFLQLIIFVIIWRNEDYQKIFGSTVKNNLIEEERLLN